MKAATIALATALLMTGGTAMAQSASDLQCLIVSNAFAKGATDTNQQKAAEASLYFYLGRVSDKTAAQLKSLLDAQSKLITDKTAGDTMKKCVQAIETKVQLLQTVAAPAQPAQQQKPPQPQPQPEGR